MLKVSELTKKYGEMTAVSSLSFTAERGKIYGLIGPNGAGKSTSIRMIMSILQPDSGTIEFEGKAFSEQDRNKIGYLPEERGLYKKQKLNEVLLYLAALKGCPASLAQKEIDRWLERFELTEWKNKKIDTLSKGMSQKAQFIGTVVHNPDILFLDEPFSGLDPVSADELLSYVRELRTQGKLILFSTHVMEQAEKVCDHIIMLNHGKKILDKDLLELRKEFGGNTVNIQLADSGESSEELSRRLSEISGIEKVIIDGSEFSLTLKKGTDVSNIFDSLAGKFRVNRFATKEQSLHSIFINLAQKKEGLS